MGEKEIHRFRAARAVGLCPYLAVVVHIMGATMIPLETLLHSYTGFPTTGGCHEEVI